MNVISRKRIRAFVRIHPDSLTALDHWFRIARKARWNNLAEIREDFPHADIVGGYTVFNIGGNKYRLISKVDHRAKLLLIREILTHQEYNKEAWKR